MKVNEVEFNATLEEVLIELQTQLNINNIAILGKMKSSGNNIMVCCPYHMEMRPSAGIRKDDGMFHCFACGETHILPEFINQCFGKNDIDGFGWKWLMQNFGTVSIEERKSINLDFNRKVINNSGDSYITEEELDKYRYLHPYMYERKLTDDIIDLFDIGYDSSDETITFPIQDGNGNVLYIAKRSVNYKWFHYPSDSDKPVYGIYQINQIHPTPNEIIICESMLDALTCWVYGRYAVATNGSQISELQFRQLENLQCRELVLATDNDEAGYKARKMIRKRIKNKLITEYDYNSYPVDAKDINDMSREEFNNLQKVF